MVKKQFGICFIAILVLLQFGPASAATLSFDPSNQSVGLSDSVLVDLRISGLGDDILTGFDLDISFDDSILGFQGFTFVTGLGPGTINDVTDSGGGIVNVFELSFETDEDLMASQPNDFVLGTFNFNALSIGTSALDIIIIGLAGEFVFDDLLGMEVASELSADTQSGSVSVIPVPAAIWLFGTALIGLVGFSKRRQAA